MNSCPTTTPQRSVSEVASLRAEYLLSPKAGTLDYYPFFVAKVLDWTMMGVFAFFQTLLLVIFVVWARRQFSTRFIVPGHGDHPDGTGTPSKADHQASSVGLLLVE
jgi:hypothetical protein